MKGVLVKKLLVLFAILVVGATATACRPGTQPGTPESVYTWQDGWNAVEQAFAPFGPVVVAQAHRVAECESNHNPYAGLLQSFRGHPYLGVFQLGPHIVAINNYGGNRLDPFQNAYAAAELYVSRGYNWSAWTCQP